MMADPPNETTADEDGLPIDKEEVDVESIPTATSESLPNASQVDVETKELRLQEEIRQAVKQAEEEGRETGRNQVIEESPILEGGVVVKNDYDDDNANNRGGNSMTVVFGIVIVATISGFGMIRHYVLVVARWFRPPPHVTSVTNSSSNTRPYCDTLPLLHDQ